MMMRDRSVKLGLNLMNCFWTSFCVCVCTEKEAIVDRKRFTRKEDKMSRLIKEKKTQKRGEWKEKKIMDLGK